MFAAGTERSGRGGPGTARTGPESGFRVAGPRVEPARGAAPCPGALGPCPWVPGRVRGSRSVGPGSPPGLGARPGGGCGALRGGSAAAWGLPGLLGELGASGSCSEPAPAAARAAQGLCGVCSQPLGDFGPAALPGTGGVQGL